MDWGAVGRKALFSGIAGLIGGLVGGAVVGSVGPAGIVPAAGLAGISGAVGGAISGALYEITRQRGLH